VEAQPAYARAHDEEDHGEGHSPQLLLPAPAPAEPQREVRAERPTRIAVRWTVPVAVQKPKPESGLYTATDVRWGAGFVIKNVSNGSLLTLDDLMGLHQERSTEVVTGLPDVLGNGGHAKRER
jgi:hypothetical protein